MISPSDELIQALIDNDLCRLNRKSLRSGSVYGKSGKTLLHLAAKYSSEPSVIEYCITVLKVKPSTLSKASRSLPIHCSSRYGKLEITKFFLSLSKKFLESKDYQGETALSLSCKYGYVDIVLMLLDAGARFSTRNKLKWTPLHWASKNGHLEIVKILISLNSPIESRTFQRETCLHLAAETGNTELVGLLLKKSDHFAESSTGTILHHCCRNESMTSFLLENSGFSSRYKLLLLLEVHATERVIMKSCRNELCMQNMYFIQLFERADLIQALYRSRIMSIKELSAYNHGCLSPKCKAMIEFLKKWHQIALFLYALRYYNVNCWIKGLPNNLLREIAKFL